MKRRCIGSLTLVLLFLAGMAWACQVPVFRYALERWVADPYRVQVLHRGGLPETLQAAVGKLSDAPVNVAVKAYDLDALSEADEWQIDGVAQDAVLPLMRVLAPRGDGQDRVVWEVPATTNTLAQLTHSPFRKKMLDEIMRGVSAVWVVVPGEDDAATDAFETVLRRDLVVLQRTLTLPEGVIHAGALEHADARPDEPIDLDDVLRSHIPLKLDFAVLRLDPSDPQEAATAALLSTLVPSEGGVVPVFGRGRALPGMAMRDYSIARLRIAAEYIVGSCSCQVKAENPGIDLIVQADWSAVLNDQLIVSGRDLPPLEGVAMVRGEAESASGGDGEADVEEGGHALRRNMVAALGLFFVFVVVGTWWTRRKAS